MVGEGLLEQCLKHNNKADRFANPCLPFLYVFLQKTFFQCLPPLPFSAAVTDVEDEPLVSV